MTILDTSRARWDSTLRRLIRTCQHRVVVDPGTSLRLDAAQRVQSAVYGAVA